MANYHQSAPDDRGIRHWVKFKYDSVLVDRIKKIPSCFRTFDPNTKEWGFNDKGWPLFCAISGVKVLGLPQTEEEIGYQPRKIDNSILDLDWNRFKVNDSQGELDLWEFQKIGISQIIRNKNHGLFFQAGLGKTYTAVCAARELLDRGEVKQVLVISLIKRVLYQWANLLDRLGYSYTLIDEEKKVDRGQIYYEAETDFVLVLYTTALAKGKVNRAKNRAFKTVFRNKAKKAPQMIIADELHKLGDVSSETYKAFLTMSRAAKYRVACTGTIIKSTPDKALTTLRFIAPKVFGNKGTFEEAFTVKEEGYFGSKIVGYKNLDRLRELIHSYGSVALKKDHPKGLPKVLPPHTVKVETSKDSLKVLKAIRAGETLRLIQEKEYVNYAQIQDLYIRVHQALVCPSVFSDGLLAKNSLEALISILDEVPGKTIIFTTLVAAVDEISNYLTKNKIENVACGGRIKESVINQRVAKFAKDENCKVMVATVQKMGTGLDDLKVAQNCIIYDFNMVGADLSQAIDRLNRYGQEHEEISIYEIIQDNVFCQYQREKVKLQENIINQTEDIKMKAQDSIELSHLLKLAEESGLFGGV